MKSLIEITPKSHLVASMAAYLAERDLRIEKRLVNAAHVLMKKHNQSLKVLLGLATYMDSAEANEIMQATKPAFMSGDAWGDAKGDIVYQGQEIADDVRALLDAITISGAKKVYMGSELYQSARLDKY